MFGANLVNIGTEVWTLDLATGMNTDIFQITLFWVQETPKWIIPTKKN